MLYSMKAVDSESYDESGNAILALKIKAVDAAIIDSKTNGALSECALVQKLPWIKDDEFDFDSVS